MDSQPQPIFTWYFDDEEIFPGDPGWEEVEVHHSRKMSTLILRLDHPPPGIKLSSKAFADIVKLYIRGSLPF